MTGSSVEFKTESGAPTVVKITDENGDPHTFFLTVQVLSVISDEKNAEREMNEKQFHIQAQMQFTKKLMP